MKAVGYRIIVKPEEVKKAVETSGGAKIYKPEQVIEKEQGGVDKGIVVDMGPDCFSKMISKWCEIGDVVVWSRYAGKPMDDPELGLVHIINDQDVLAVDKATH